MTIHTTDTLLLFVRLPVKGRVKTRLADGLTRFMDREAADSLALSLHEAFVADLMTTLSNVPALLQVHVDPCGLSEDDALVEARRWLGQGPLLHVQQGADLGERMAAAFQDAFSEPFQRALLLGGDVPDVPAPILAGAFEVLHQVDAVLGPAMDGGYYAIGFTRRAFSSDVFKDVAWGKSTVAATTRARLQGRGASHLLLPEWNDVDEVKDLNTLFRTNRLSSFRHSRTYAILERHAAMLETLNLDLPDPEEVMGADHVLARLESRRRMFPKVTAEATPTTPSKS